MLDPLFQVQLRSATPNPQQVVWAAMHQDYSEHYVAEEPVPDEEEAGRICVLRLLTGERGHYGPLEHPQITVDAGYFPHDVMQQARTHRIGVSFDVQSGRYTGDRILSAARDELPLEEVFYLRPVGRYHDRSGKHYTYHAHQRAEDLTMCRQLVKLYANRIEEGFANEHARGLIPYAIRQHFVVSFTLRSALHFLDLRHKADAQLEIQEFSKLLLEPLKAWAPQLVGWYEQYRLNRGRLAP